MVLGSPKGDLNIGILLYSTNGFLLQLIRPDSGIKKIKDVQYVEPNAKSE